MLDQEYIDQVERYMENIYKCQKAREKANDT